MTNLQFAQTNVFFRAGCSAANAKPTSRQASKWRNNKGSALEMARQFTFRYMLALVANNNQLIIDQTMT